MFSIGTMYEVISVCCRFLQGIENRFQKRQLHSSVYSHTVTGFAFQQCECHCQKGGQTASHTKTPSRIHRRNSKAKFIAGSGDLSHQLLSSTM